MKKAQLSLENMFVIGGALLIVTSVILALSYANVFSIKDLQSPKCDFPGAALKCDDYTTSEEGFVMRLWNNNIKKDYTIVSFEARADDGTICSSTLNEKIEPNSLSNVIIIRCPKKMERNTNYDIKYQFKIGDDPEQYTSKGKLGGAWKPGAVKEQEKKEEEKKEQRAKAPTDEMMRKAPLTEKEEPTREEMAKAPTDEMLKAKEPTEEMKRAPLTYVPTDDMLKAKEPTETLRILEPLTVKDTSIGEVEIIEKSLKEEDSIETRKSITQVPVTEEEALSMIITRKESDLAEKVQDEIITADLTETPLEDTRKQQPLTLLT